MVLSASIFDTAHLKHFHIHLSITNPSNIKGCELSPTKKPLNFNPYCFKIISGSNHSLNYDMTFPVYFLSRLQFNLLVTHFFFSVRLLSVLRGHLFFSSPSQRPMTSDFEGFSIPDFIHYIYLTILILEKEPVFSLLSVQC